MFHQRCNNDICGASAVNSKYLSSSLPRDRKHALKHAHLIIGVLAETARAIETNLADVARLIKKVLKKCELCTALVRELGDAARATGPRDRAGYAIPTNPALSAYSGPKQIPAGLWPTGMSRKANGSLNVLYAATCSNSRW